MTTTYKLDQLIRREWIKEVYTGREEGCRCGCYGNYFEPGEIGFARALNKAFKLNPDVVLCDTYKEVDHPIDGVCAKTRQAVAADGKPRAYAFANTLTNRIEWVDLVLDGRYPYLKTITLYTDAR